MNETSPHHWPAEWETQAATWVAWPHNLDTWPGHFDNIPGHFKQFILTLAETQPVHVLSGPNSVTAHDALRGVRNVTVHDVLTNDAWIRDYGPTFVRRKDDQSLVGIDWQYNAWGGKYPPYDDDAKVAEFVCRELRCQRSVSPLYCEGGALDTDGQGTLLTTSSCLLSASRNPGWSREMIEEQLRIQLGVTKILWVDGGGLLGDDTDGHIDQLARFVNENTVVAATSSQRDDPNRVGLEANVSFLRESRNAADEKLSVYPLPTPPPRHVDGTRVPESYCNFLIANEIVIVPTFRNESTDRPALDLLASLIPNKRVVPLDAYDLIWGLGAFHCASQQQPAA